MERSKLKKNTWFYESCRKQEDMDIETAAGTTCVKCGTDTTSRQWFNCKDKPGAKICTTCYQKNLLEVATAAATTCVTSGTDTTSRWVNWKPVPGTKICMACYNKNLRKKKRSAKANDE